MILVDTSVWIRHLSGAEPFLSGLTRILRGYAVWSHELVFGELLIGDIGGRRKVLADYSLLPAATPISHSDLLRFVYRHALHGWIDAHLLASAATERMPLWMADGNLAKLAEELGVGYALPAS